MKNKKGFTLIELLAVIVILAIIMVIAVPQILNVIDSSRTSAWNNSAKLIKNAIITNTTLYNTTSSQQIYTVPGLCSEPSKMSEIADIGDIEDITCIPNESSNKYAFKLIGKSQFAGKSATIICTKEGKCDLSIGNELYLYNLGDENNNITGGWLLENGQQNGTYQRLENSIHLSYTSIFYCESHMQTINSIDLSGYSKININYTFNSIDNYDHGCLNYSVGSLSGRSPKTSPGNYTETYDIASVSSGKITFSNCACDINIHKIWLER